MVGGAYLLASGWGGGTYVPADGGVPSFQSMGEEWWGVLTFPPAGGGWGGGVPTFQPMGSTFLPVNGGGVVRGTYLGLDRGQHIRTLALPGGGEGLPTFQLTGGVRIVTPPLSKT